MTQKPNGVFRPKRVNFAQVSNTALKDGNLSLKAKGLYSLIQSLITLPRNDGLKIQDISDKCKEGDSAFESAWIELKKCGYLKQYRIPDIEGKGQFRYEYTLLDEPDLSTPSMVNLTVKGEVSTVHSQPDSQEESNKKCEKKLPKHKSKAESDHTPENRVNGADHQPGFPPYGKPTPCSNHPVQKGGDNSNTKSGNTFFSNTKSGNIQSISQENDTDKQTDIIKKELLSQIDIDWIEEVHSSDLPAAKALIDSMTEMLINPYTKIGGVKQSKSELKKRLETVTELDIIGFLEHMREKDTTGINNKNAYWKTAFINYLNESDLTASTL